MIWYHPKYYAELRKQRRKLTSSQATSDKPASPEPRAQAASQKQQAPGSERQGTSGKTQA
jgi:hypothetical protein